MTYAPVPLVEISGRPYERGVAYGRAASERIKRSEGGSRVSYCVEGLRAQVRCSFGQLVRDVGHVRPLAVTRVGAADWHERAGGTVDEHFRAHNASL